MPKDTTNAAKRSKRYNAFNIFFMLERQLLLHERGGGINVKESPIDTTESPLSHPDRELWLPELSLCPRYSHLPLTQDAWFLELTAHGGKKRVHVKTHGVISFKELAGTISKRYREIDDHTRKFVHKVASILTKHLKELEAIEDEGRLAAFEKTISQPPPEVMSATAATVFAMQNKRKEVEANLSGHVANKRAKRSSSSLSQDEALTVQQLVGLKAQSPPTAARHQPVLADQPHSMASQYQLDTSAVTYQAQGSNSFSSARSGLLLEMERAIQAHLESEMRIHALTERLAVHDVLAIQDARALQDLQEYTSTTQAQQQYPSSVRPSSISTSPRYDSRASPSEEYVRYLSLLSASGAGYPSSRRTSQAQEAPRAEAALARSTIPSSVDTVENNNSYRSYENIFMAKFEEELMREALIRRMRRAS